MKKAKAVLTTGSVNDFFKRALDRAAKLDRGEKLREEIRVTFEDPADLVRALTAERIRVLQAIRTGGTQGKSKLTTVSSLAATLKRDRKSVVRDVNVLEGLGLLITRRQPNPGHGAIKVVEPLAKKYRLTATV
jgi:predicted transcriptional regulator